MSIGRFPTNFPVCPFIAKVKFLPFQDVFKIHTGNKTYLYPIIYVGATALIVVNSLYDAPLHAFAYNSPFVIISSVPSIILIIVSNKLFFIPISFALLDKFVTLTNNLQTKTVTTTTHIDVTVIKIKIIT